MVPILPKSKNTKNDAHCASCASRIDSVFCRLSPEQTATLDTCKSDNLYKKGQVLFYEGNPCVGVYCVYTGQIKLYRTGSLGRQQIMGIATPGSVLVYRALFSEQPYSLTAEALEDSRVCFIDKRTFLSLITANPDTAQTILKKLSQDLTSAEDKLMDLVDKPVPVRLARLLLMLKEAYGRPGPKGVVMDVILTRTEMAEMIGTTPETAMRTLSVFKKKGLINLKGREITVTNADGLMRAARLNL